MRCPVPKVIQIFSNLFFFQMDKDQEGYGKFAFTKFTNEELKEDEVEETKSDIPEGYEELCSFWCKMQRFADSDSETDKEWKERGRGKIQVLKCNVTLLYRVIMYRDAVLLLCANHYVPMFAKIEYSRAKEDPRFYVTYDVEDYSDEEDVFKGKIRYKFTKEEEAKKLHEVLLECQKQMKGGLVKDPPKKEDSSEEEEHEGEDEKTLEEYKKEFHEIILKVNEEVMQRMDLRQIKKKDQDGESKETLSESGIRLHKSILECREKLKEEEEMKKEKPSFFDNIEYTKDEHNEDV